MANEEWRNALVTNEDRFHVHKTLGTFCLLSFVWRFAQGTDSDLGFSSHPHWTLPTLGLHLLLSASAFGFRIPPRRINEGSRIWPEYRLHSLVFLCRSLACMALVWYSKEQHRQEAVAAPDNTAAVLYIWRLGIVITAMATADIGSYCYGGSKQTIRKLQAPGLVRYLFSVMQMWATSTSLYHSETYAPHFVFCAIIQCNAFLMTLRRKNILGHYVIGSLYAFMLLLGAFILKPNDPGRADYAMVLTANTAALVRLAPRLPKPLALLQSKYMLWPTLLFFMHRLVQLGDKNGESRGGTVPIITDHQLVFAKAFSDSIVAFLGVYKVWIEYGEHSEEDGGKLVGQTREKKES
jgi:hypothetical protein